MKITAKEARELAGMTAEEEVEGVYELIREAATEKKRSVFLHTNFWTHGGYDKKEDWKKAKLLLEEDGFKVEFFYEEKQFVNMYTIVSW
jgi:hypothetical protein